MSNSLNQALSLDIKASLQKTLLIVAPHLIGALVLLFTYKRSMYGVWFSGALLIGIIVSLFYYLRLHGQMKLGRSILAINRSPQNQWSITTRQDGSKSVELTHSYSGKYLIILNYLDPENRKYTVYITPDSVSSEIFRQLKVLLKIQKTSD